MLLFLVFALFQIKITHTQKKKKKKKIRKEEERVANTRFKTGKQIGALTERLFSGAHTFAVFDQRVVFSLSHYWPKDV